MYLLPLRLLFLLFTGFYCTTLRAQNQAANTAEKKILLSDTTLAQQLLDTAQAHLNARQYEEALVSLDSASVLIERSVGKESTKYATILYWQARCFNRKRQVDTAIEKYKAGLDIQIRVSGEKQEDIAKIYDELGHIYERAKEDDDTALAYYQKAFGIWEHLYNGKHEQAEHVLMHIGDIYMKKKYEYDTAFSIFERMLNVAIDVHGKDHFHVAFAYYRLGEVSNYSGNYVASIDYSKKAADIQKKLYGENTIWLAHFYYNLSGAYSDNGNYEQALFYGEKNLKIYIDSFGVNHPIVAAVYAGLGNTLTEMGDLDSAFSYLQKAWEIQLQLDNGNNLDIVYTLIYMKEIYKIKGDYKNALKSCNKALDILNNFQESFLALAWTYQSFGDIYTFTGDYSHAIPYLEKALAYSQKVFKEFGYMIGDVYTNFGNLYSNQNEYQKALLYYQKAVSIALQMHGEVHWRVSLAYSNMSNCYSNLEESGSHAVEYQEKSLNINQKLYSAEHPEIARGYYNLGSIYLKNNQADSASSYFEKALKVYTIKFGAYHEGVANCYLGLGDVDLKKGDYEAALANYEKALIANRFEKNRDENVLNLKVLVETFRKFGGLYLEQPKDGLALSKARHYFLKSLEIIDTLRQTFVEGGSKQVLLQKNYAVYEKLLKTDYSLFQRTDSLAYLQQAYQYANHAKSQLLNEGMRELDALRFAGLQDSLLQQEYNLRIDITYYEKRKQDLLNANKLETDSVVLAISNKLFDLKQKYENLKKRFEIEYPEYYRLKYDLSTVSAEEAQHQLLQPNQALLEYFVGDSSLFVFVLRPDTLVMQEVKKDFPLEDWVKSLRENIYLNRTTGATAYTEAAYNLYQKLILPVKSLLPEQIIIIPDGILGYVPFEALLTAKPERAVRFNTHPYLLKEHQISYCYSASLLREMQQKKKVKEPTETLLAVAPFYTGDTTLLAGIFAYDETTRKDLSPLQNSGEEVYRINKLWKGDVLTGAAATEAAFTERAGNYRILHLATHGRADERVGDYSFLAFSEIKDSVENELLYVRDLYNLQLNADLVVLSACETGLGKLSRGEGIISLARAFAYAGAKSIVTTLWSVDDAKTKDLMVDFYRKLKKGMTKDAALRQAKLDYLESHSNPGDAHPFYWAGFAPIGDMRALR